MFPDICDSLFKTNTLIIGDRNCGKTTFLKQVINLAIDSGYRIIVFDSATDHVNKSILVYCKRIFNNYLEIKSPEKEFIDCKNGGKQFPYGFLKDKRLPKICLFDVSRYLEEGFLYEVNNPMRNTTRLLYKKLVVQCLVVLYEFLHNSKSIVIMDEIEFVPDFKNVIKKYNDKNIHFINCLHTEDSCNNNIKTLFDIRIVKRVFPTKTGVICKKSEEMLCGPACLHYLLNILQKRNVEIPNNLVWITDIAKYLSELKIEHDLSCCESLLYNDYMKGCIHPEHNGALSIDNYLATGKKIAIKKFVKGNILFNKLPDTYFIASIRSKFLDNTKPDDSYHFILVHLSMDIFTIICPRRTDYSIISMGIDMFEQMINQSGNWIIKIR